MDINDLHDLRDGASPRRRRQFNPFIHLSTETPLMRMLFSITRPGAAAKEHHLANKRVTARKKIIHAAGAAPSAPPAPSGSMVSYAKERHITPNPKPDQNLPKR
jgi:hypothetical protein